jgi:hypothetical protein
MLHNQRQLGCVVGLPDMLILDPLNGMVRRRSLEVVEYGGKEASHETTRAGH